MRRQLDRQRHAVLLPQQAPVAVGQEGVFRGPSREQVGVAADEVDGVEPQAAGLHGVENADPAVVGPAPYRPAADRAERHHGSAQGVFQKPQSPVAGERDRCGVEPAYLRQDRQHRLRPRVEIRVLGSAGEALQAVAQNPFERLGPGAPGRRPRQRLGHPPQPLDGAGEGGYLRAQGLLVTRRRGPLLFVGSGGKIRFPPGDPAGEIVLPGRVSAADAPGAAQAVPEVRAARRIASLQTQQAAAEEIHQGLPREVTQHGARQVQCGLDP